MHRTAIVAALMVGGLLLAGPAEAAGSGLPDTKLRLQSVVLVPRTGAVEVTARTRCEGVGSMRWEAAVTQSDRRDRESSKVPCDGVTRTQTLVLRPKSGRFHAGQALFALGDIICGKDVCIGALSARYVRLMPHRDASPVNRPR
jgi:hypothetical protein